MLVNSVPQSWSPTLRTGAPTPKPQMKTPVCRMIIGYLAGLGVREEDANGHSKTVSLDHWEASERQEHPGAGGGGLFLFPGSRWPRTALELALCLHVSLLPCVSIKRTVEE